MSQENDESSHKPVEGGGLMVGHIERYKNYISDLKRGGSSGISAAFGRASDLLPPEVLEISPPAKPAADVALPRDQPAQIRENLDLGAHVFTTVDSPAMASVREKVKGFAAQCSIDLTEPIGEVVDTPYGQLAVEEVFVEGDARLFLLSDQRVIDEPSFQRWKRVDNGDIAATAVVEPISDTFSSAPGGDGFADATRLRVTAPNGGFLWDVHFDGYEPMRVEMFDGSLIARAEGRDDMVLALKSGGTDGLKLYLLSGLMVDPTTGNVFVESNQGAYTAGFLNNGWRIHQYRTRDKGEQYFVTEPIVPGREPLTIQVSKLNLDMETGEVSYETIDNAAVVTLRTRKL